MTPTPYTHAQRFVNLGFALSPTLAFENGVVGELSAVDMGDGTLLGPSADAGLAAILENQNKPADAAAAYVAAADAADSPLFTPMHLLSAARAYLAAKRPDDARRVLERIEADYAESPEAQDVAFMLGQADALAPATPAR